MTLTNSVWERRGARVAFVVAAWMLASCAAPEQISQANEEQCTNYGIQPGTTDFTACMTQEDLGVQYFDSYIHPSQPYFYR
jgi:hypothetical protein